MKRQNNDTSLFDRVINRITLKGERAARVSLILCASIIAGSCMSVSALSLKVRDQGVDPDQAGGFDSSSIVITYEDFDDITSDDEGMNEEDRSKTFLEDAKARGVFLGSYTTEEEDDEEVDPETIRNTAPKDLTDRQVTRMLSGEAGPVRIIDRQDINEGAPNSGMSQDTGNQSAEANAASNSSGVTSHFDSANNYVIGIDVSGYNKTIDWVKVRDYGVKFVMIKCGGRYYGTSGNGGKLYKDSKFETYVSGATAAGIQVGVYFYSAAITVAEAYEEASYTIDLIRGKNITYPVAIDYEVSGNERHKNIKGKALRDILCTFCDTIASQGYSPMVYMSQSYWNNALGSTYASEVTSKYKVWLAAYFNRFMSGTEPFKIGDKLPTFSYRYHIWQYGYLHGVVPGIDGDVDMNLGFMSTSTLLDPSISLKSGDEIRTTVGTVVNLKSGLAGMNSLGQTVSVDNFNITVKNSSGTTVTVDKACSVAGVYDVTYTFGDAYRGSVTRTVQLLVADANGNVPGYETDTHASPATEAAATTAAAPTAAAETSASAPSDSASQTSEAAPAETSASAPSDSAPTADPEPVVPASDEIEEEVIVG
ncbi:Lyzozyme M1 (1,4-beta-N-acetylmuramidase), GH25 family [Ruminococcaceae bacterium YRB3002]|nr:Lyzozyme M1 (1,4-beta-N-acetylmuramidase), GH25 family [Ruminococcaceae bacterium YRB3002]